MKVRKKQGGYVVSVTPQGDGTFKDDDNGMIYTASDLIFKCPEIFFRTCRCYPLHTLHRGMVFWISSGVYLNNQL